MEDHVFLPSESSRLDDTLSLHNPLPHHIRDTRSPSMTVSSTQHSAYQPIGHSYEYNMGYHSSLPTPVSGAGSPSSPGSNPDLPTVKHEPGNADHGSPSSASRAGWPYGVVYPSHPHSPGDLSQQSHAYSMYDGLDVPDDSDIPQNAVTEASYWPSPALTTQAMPYSMEPAPPGMIRHDMPMGHPVHSLHHSSHLHQPSHEVYEQRNYHASTPSSADMRGINQPYPPFHHTPPSFVHSEHNLDRRGHSRAGGSRSQKAPRKPTAPRRPRNKRPGNRPRAGSDNGPDKFPYNVEERLVLDDNTKEQDRYLYNLRCEHGGRNGDDMWDVIVEQYGERYAHKQKATLQMQLNRAVAKHQVWPETERALLADVMKDIVPLIRRELEERGGSNVMGFCNEQILAQLMREGYASVDSESSNSSPAVRRAKLMIARYNKSRSGSSCALKEQQQLPDLTPDELDYIMESEAQRHLATQNASSMQLGNPQHGLVDVNSNHTNSTSQGNHSGRTSMTCQEAAYLREAYQIAVNNGSVASI